jgi:hypothetical protein
MKRRRRKIPQWRRTAILKKFIDEEDEEREAEIGQGDDKPPPK